MNEEDTEALKHKNDKELEHIKWQSEKMHSS
jgi:hypothetical protein